MNGVAATVAMAATLGFASSLHCIGMCGGFSLLLAARREGRLGRLAAFHGGRLLSYAFLGVLARVVPRWISLPMRRGGEVVAAAVGLAAVVGEPLAGTLALMACGAATVPALVAVALVRSCVREPWRARFASLAGVTTLCVAALTLWRGFAVRSCCAEQ